MPAKKNKLNKEKENKSLISEQKNVNPFDFNHNEIEKALFDRAKGFEYYEIIFEPGENEEEERIIKRTKKTVIPDVTACIFWLKNKLPDKWKDPKDIEEDKQSLKDFLEHYYDED
ncbi:MAG: hypothetical protein ACHQJ4_01005 [Ignavibacteria bacterium]